MAIKKRRDDDEAGNSLLDPETEAIAAEFENEKQPVGAPKPADIAVPKPDLTLSGDTGVPSVGQEDATVKPSVLPSSAESLSTTVPEKNPAGAGVKNYDVVEGGQDVGWGDTSRLSGFNTNEWGPGGSEGYHDNSVKNVFGKLATRYDPSPDGARQIVNDPDFKRMFPQAELIDHPTDPKIRFYPDDPPVDVLAASGAGGWQWLPEGDGGGGGGAGGVGGGGLDTSGIDALADGDILKKIQEALAAMGKGEQPFMDDAISQEFA